MWERLQLLLQQGKSILLTTHFMDEPSACARGLLVLDHGRKIAQGRPRDLIAQTWSLTWWRLTATARWHWSIRL